MRECRDGKKNNNEEGAEEVTVRGRISRMADMSALFVVSNPRPYPLRSNPPTDRFISIEK
jgi:hypothetical protein